MKQIIGIDIIIRGIFSYRTARRAAIHVAREIQHTRPRGGGQAFNEVLQFRKRRIVLIGQRFQIARCPENVLTAHVERAGQRVNRIHAGRVATQH